MKEGEENSGTFHLTPIDVDGWLGVGQPVPVLTPEQIERHQRLHPGETPNGVLRAHVRELTTGGLGDWDREPRVEAGQRIVEDLATGTLGVRILEPLLRRMRAFEEPMRTVGVAYWFLGCDEREIAAKLGVSVGTVNFLLRVGREMLTDMVRIDEPIWPDNPWL